MFLKKSGKTIFFTISNNADKRFLYRLYFMWASLFKGSFNLRNFDRNLFLVDIDFCKPGVVQGLSLKFNLFLEVF